MHKQDCQLSSIIENVHYSNTIVKTLQRHLTQSDEMCQCSKKFRWYRKVKMMRDVEARIAEGRLFHAREVQNFLDICTHPPKYSFCEA